MPETVAMTRHVLGTILIALCLSLLPAWVPAHAQIIQVPPGNRSVSQPKIPAGAVSRTRATNGSFQGKYEKIRDLIARDRKLQSKIKTSAQHFGIAPVHIVGALVGEHTYNVDALDFLQSYLVKAANYLKAGIEFAYEGEDVTDFVKRPQFAACSKHKDSYRLWACREDVWNKQFAGKSVGGKAWPRDRFGRVFFQPLYAGQTFGLGQLNPLAALSVTDFVNRKTGAPRLDADKPGKVYETIMDPDSTLDYMAAIIRLSIDSYRSIAGFDISGNPGVTATLYNLGDVIDRAEAAKRKRSADPNWLPEENYYGWLVNDKLNELQRLVR